jgi:hypothetical protein
MVTDENGSGEGEVHARPHVGFVGFGEMFKLSDVVVRYEADRTTKEIG